MTIGGIRLRPALLLFGLMPVRLLLQPLHAPAVWVFAVAGAALIPLAGAMGRATEHLAAHFGAGVGGLLNATFGNAAELIIALLALRQGLLDVVKASITGSIIGNLLLVGGLSMLAGGLRFERQRFNATAAGLSASILLLSSIALLLPAVVFYLPGGHTENVEPREFSLLIARVLFVTSVLSLVFSLRTHRHLFAGEPDDHGGLVLWSRRRALSVLVVATAGVAIEAELLVRSVEHTAELLGFSDVFVGVILLALVGNAAEHSTAILVAMKNKMDLALNIALGSSVQVALLIAPITVFASYLFAKPMDLIFTPLEVVAVLMASIVVAVIAVDGESHWMEGVLLVAVYAILGVAFFFSI